ncbi:AdoMet-dependent rRNA methyltransferase spb1 [Xanthoria parietina]
MGIQKKHGKGRLDKWYKLAKEKGYRARAAFKLIQLNRKYGFLEKSKVLLDLCAAPGSWCQVAAETMPINSLILGVDLAPIKPIPRTTTFQGDITSDKCRATIRQHFKTWKADTVLHDGAPNVGTAWVQDAFSQAELALQALKLATEFLVEGGTFVTKVFRSKDYNALLWVCNQLFSKVDATKPPSSRNVSAEIFVVCRGFKAPKKIDPRLLEPRSVFAELSNPTPNNEAKVFNPEVKKRKREGYEEGDYTQFREAPASEFVQTTDPIAMLGSLNRLHFARAGHEGIALAALDQLPETTPEIRHCCSDLKVLGRKEFRILLRWRSKARERFGLAIKKVKQDDTNGEVAQVIPMDEEAAVQEELAKLDQNESARKKRERRRAHEKRQKEITRMQMNMLPPTEIGLEQAGPNGEDSMFTLGALDSSRAIDITKGNMGIVLQRTPRRESDSESFYGSDEEQDGLDSELDKLYGEYQQRRSETDAKYRAKKARTEHEENDWDGIVESVASSDDDVEMDRLSSSSKTSEDDEPTFQQPASTNKQSTLTHRAALFFDQDVFGILDQVNPANSSSHGSEEKRISDLSEKPQRTSSPTNRTKQSSDLRDVADTTNLKSRVAQDGIVTDERSLNRTAKVPSRSESDDITGQPSIREENENWKDPHEPQKNGRLDIDIITAEAMTLARQVATGTRTTRDLVDDTFNKYAFQDRDGLPEWFLDDEGKHSKPHRPIDAAAAKAIKEKLRALNVRPIKKVREAKDRKKFKAAQRLEKLRKKSTLLADEDGLSEKDKAQNIANLMSKAAKKKPKKEVKLVVARGGNRGISGRPRGVKGKYKIVDARLKKDTRAEKRLAKKKR